MNRFSSRKAEKTEVVSSLFLVGQSYYLRSYYVCLKNATFPVPPKRGINTQGKYFELQVRGGVKYSHTPEVDCALVPCASASRSNVVMFNIRRLP